MATFRSSLKQHDVHSVDYDHTQSEIDDEAGVCFREWLVTDKLLGEVKSHYQNQLLV